MLLRRKLSKITLIIVIGFISFINFNLVFCEIRSSAGLLEDWFLVLCWIIVILLFLIGLCIYGKIKKFY